MPAKASAEWKGDLPSGSGTFTAGDTISGGYTFKSRFEDGPGSNPEQLIGAAHAACFSMALSSLLAQAGNPPDLVHTDATVTLRLVGGVHRAGPGGQGGVPGQPGPGRGSRDHARGVAHLLIERGRPPTHGRDSRP